MKIEDILKIVETSESIADLVTPELPIELIVDLIKLGLITLKKAGEEEITSEKVQALYRDPDYLKRLLENSEPE